MSDYTEDQPVTKDIVRKAQRRRKRILGAVILLGAAIAIVTKSKWLPECFLAYSLIQVGGIVLIFFGICGRTWCTLYIGGKKGEQLICVGPYSIVRNPLYLFSVFGALGVGAQTGSLIFAFAASAIVFIVFCEVVVVEERFLQRKFPVEFENYMRCVPRFLPRFSGWADVEQLNVMPGFILRTFRDACAFLLAIPVTSILQELQRRELVYILFTIP